MDNEKIDIIRAKYMHPSHYYGDLVRKIFVAASLIMTATLPFLNHRLVISPFLSILAIIIIASVAGFISPYNKRIFIVNFLISISGVLVFEYNAVSAYTTTPQNDPLFMVNQILAILFLVALYYTSKTVRASYLES